MRALLQRVTQPPGTGCLDGVGRKEAEEERLLGDPVLLQ